MRFNRWAFDPGPAPAGAREDADNEQDHADFHQLLGEARSGSEAARSELRGFQDDGVVVSAVQTQNGPVIVTVDSSLLVRRLRMRALQGYDQRMWWLLRAAGIAHLAWERRRAASFVQDVPQLSDWLPGQPSFLDLLGAVAVGWPGQDAVERADREEFLAEALIRAPDGAVA